MDNELRTPSSFRAYRNRLRSKLFANEDQALFWIGLAAGVVVAAVLLFQFRDSFAKPDALRDIFKVDTRRNTVVGFVICALNEQCPPIAR